MQIELHTRIDKFAEKIGGSPIEKENHYPCWSLGALIEISVKIIENDYYFLSSAKDFAYSHLLNSVNKSMQKHDNITEATVCFLLGLLKQIH